MIKIEITQQRMHIKLINHIIHHHHSQYLHYDMMFTAQRKDIVAISTNLSDRLSTSMEVALFTVYIYLHKSRIAGQ